MSLNRLDEIHDNEWWYLDSKTEIWHRFQKKDYHQKINELYCFISMLGTENDKLKEELRIKNETV